MIRPFDLSHVWLVRDLQNATTILDPQTALVEARSPLRNALRSYLPLLSSRMHTYVLKASNSAPSLCGFMQARDERTGTSSRIIYLAPGLESSDDAATVWHHLLTYGATVAGERRVQRLFACLQEDHTGEDMLRQVGFATYARHTLYVRMGQLPPSGRPSTTATPVQASDNADLQKLFLAVTPRPILESTHMQERPATVAGRDVVANQHEQGYVWRQTNGELAAYLYIVAGRHGAWMRAISLPEQRDLLPEMIEHGIAIAGGCKARLIYCAARDYEANSPQALDHAGFRVQGRYRLWVKHIAVPIRAAQRQLVQPLENRASIAPTVSRSVPG